MKIIQKINLINFKRFENLTMDFDNNLNILIGDNEAGKSTILSAIDLVISGSRSKIESIGLDNLFNAEAIQRFMNSPKEYINLPRLEVELFLNEQNNHLLNGRNNSENIECDGLRLICKPDDSFSNEIKEILNQSASNFPYEYYSISFLTFNDEAYSGYRKFMRHVLIDNTQINNEYATRAYVKAMYTGNSSDAERNKHQYQYRKAKDDFRQDVLTELNERVSDYDFSIKSGSQTSLETDLTISENNINIENKGKGKQCFIKTEFALSKKGNDKGLDIILIEEPENHLSHVNMKMLIRKICDSDDKQIFISTHNNLISQRLDLRKSILLNSTSNSTISLQSLEESTAKFFMKASNHNVLEFVLSKKVILVEGDAEYILMEAFYKNTTSKTLEEEDIHIIAIGGTSFKRFLDIACLLNIKTAVIRDNDRDYPANCVESYSDYLSNNNIRIFSETDNEKWTFEILLYEENKVLCDNLFLGNRRTLSVQEFMQKNKADCAFELLDNYETEISTPQYVKEAIEWIKE